MLIIDPTQGRTSAEPPKATTRVPWYVSDRVCLFSNAKPNASELLLGIARQVERLHGAPLFTKQSAALPAPEMLLDQIADEFDAALVAIGD